jgi:uncharacterized membrane protein YfcA
MDDLVLFAIAGFCASFVDGALGMGFGPTSSSILLGSGLAPQAASTAVNLAKIATGVASAVSHWQFNNIDRKLVLRLAIPGCIGALAGVTVLSSVPASMLRPILAVLLVVVGLRILFRFALMTSNAASPEGKESDDAPPSFKVPGVEIAAATGGMTNGLIGAWGPVVTPFLLHRGVPPRFSVGCVNTSEIAVAFVSAFTLLSSFGAVGLNYKVVLAMLLGGIVAAPIAAWVIRYVPPRPMGIATAALLLLTNVRELIAWSGLDGGRWAIYSAVLTLLAIATAAPRLFALPAAPPPRAPGFTLHE